jgi:hypothetical protein
MIEAILNNEWAQFLALILTIISGIAALWFFWDKIRLMIGLIIKWFALFNNLQLNPFTDQGRIKYPGHFFGRERLLSTIFEELQKGTNLSLIGESQVGKSSFLYHVYQRGAEKIPEKAFIHLDMLVVHNEDDFFKALCFEIGIKQCRGSELHRALQGKQYVLCLDNIERMTNKLFSGDERVELRGLAEGTDAPLTLLIASGTPLSELFPDSQDYSPLHNICRSMDILPFSKAEVQSFIKIRLRAVGKQFTAEEINQIWEATQGHPARVQEVARQLYHRKFKLKKPSP